MPFSVVLYFLFLYSQNFVTAIISIYANETITFETLPKPAFLWDRALHGSLFFSNVLYFSYFFSKFLSGNYFNLRHYYDPIWNFGENCIIVEMQGGTCYVIFSYFLYSYFLVLQNFVRPFISIYANIIIMRETSAKSTLLGECMALYCLPFSIIFLYFLFY